jgi:hypothetical protein
MQRKFNRTWRVVLIVIVVLTAVRLALPYIVTRYVNKVLNEMSGYRGTVQDVDIHLLRGAYTIHQLKIFKEDGNKEIPFVDIPLSDMSIEWGALFQGAIVGELVFDKPTLNFISSKKGPDSGKGGQAGEDVDWTVPIKKLMPLDINKLRINEGKIAFYDFSTKPKVDLFLTHVQMDALNLNNAKDNPEKLPSRVYLQAQSIGNGQLNLAMKINILKEVPDIDMDLRFENVDMKALNDFFGAYARVDVEKGEFNLYSEVAVLDGKIDGYVKPLFNGLKVVDLKSDIKQPGELVWESMVGFIKDLLKNQRKNQLATKVPLEGHIAKVNTPFLPTLWGIFSNAFVHAFENSTDGSISIASAAKQDDTEAKIVGVEKSKKEIRREKRRERREDKKKQKRERKTQVENEKAANDKSRDDS